MIRLRPVLGIINGHVPAACETQRIVAGLGFGFRLRRRYAYDFEDALAGEGLRRGDCRAVIGFENELDIQLGHGVVEPAQAVHQAGQYFGLVVKGHQKCVRGQFCVVQLAYFFIGDLDVHAAVGTNPGQYQLEAECRQVECINKKAECDQDRQRCDNQPRYNQRRRQRQYDFLAAGHGDARRVLRGDFPQPFAGIPVGAEMSLHLPCDVEA